MFESVLAHVHDLADRALFRFMFACALRRPAHGFDVRVAAMDDATAERAAARVAAAFRLIARHDPRRLARMVRDMPRIFVSPLLAGPAVYHERHRCCELEVGLAAAPETDAARLAVILAHEATHARLHRAGFAYVPATRYRIEQLCARAERALAERLPGNLFLLQEIDGRMALGPEAWTDQAFESRAARERAILRHRLRRWRAPRGQAAT